MALIYKVVETSSVTDEELEAILNEWSRKGWSFDQIHFAMRESSKRPSMAFVCFTREEESEGAGASADNSPAGEAPLDSVAG